MPKRGIKLAEDIKEKVRINCNLHNRNHPSFEFSSAKTMHSEKKVECVFKLNTKNYRFV